MKNRLATALWMPICGILVTWVGSFEASGSTAIVVSVPDQKLALICNGARVAVYKVSTSRFGLSDRPSSYGTPLGKLEVAERIGQGLPIGAVLKKRRATGEVLAVNAAGRDPIVTRILHLRGLESCNQNAHDRGIYIHGTPVERTLGRPDSWGCIRMRSKDVIALFEVSAVGTSVEIANAPLRSVLPGALVATRSDAVALPVIAESAPVVAPSKVAPSKPDSRPKASPAVPEPLATLHSEKWGASHTKKPLSASAAHGAKATELPSLGAVGSLHSAQGSQAHGMGLSLQF
jgi:L,D-transpeptidase catalytic domain